MNRLVIRAPNWLGDAVMALPAMGALRAAFPAAHVAVAAIPAIAPLFDEATSAAQDSVIVAADSRAEIAALTAGGFDTIVLLPNSFRSAWSARRAKIPERWGYSAGFRRWLLTRAVARPRGRVHQSAYYLNLVAELGAARAIPGRVSRSGPRRSPGPMRCWPLTASPLTPAASGSRPAPPTATRSAGRRAWWPRRSSVSHARRRVRCLLFGAGGRSRFRA